MQPTVVLAFTVLIASMVVPGALAEPVLKVTIVFDEEEVTIKPGGRTTVGLNVTVEFKDYPCTTGTKVGVDLVPAASPPDWFGANPHPGGDTYAAPKQTKPATLTIVVDEDAPGSANGVYRLQPVVKLPAATDCANTEPTIDAPEFTIRVKTPPAPASSEPTDDEGANGGDSPGASLGSLLVVGLCVLLLRRRRQ